MDDYDRLINEAKRRLTVAGGDPGLDLDGNEVQLSVRIPSGLRNALNSIARRRGVTLTALETGVFLDTVGSERDPFVALAADLADNTRAELSTAVARGDYAAAAAAIDTAASRAH